MKSIKICIADTVCILGGVCFLHIGVLFLKNNGFLEGGLGLVRFDGTQKFY